MSIDTIIKNIAFQSDSSLLLVTLENFILPRDWAKTQDFEQLVQIQARQRRIRWRKYHIWDFSTAQWRFISEFPAHAKLATSDRSGRWIAYDGQQSSNQTNACLGLFDITSNTSRSAIPLSDSDGHIENIVFSYDGCNVAVSWNKFHASAWNISTGVAIGTLKVSDGLKRLALCSSRTKIAVVTWSFSMSHTLTVHEITSGDRLWFLCLGSDKPDSLDFSLNGEVLVLEHGSTCKIYGSMTGTLTQNFSWHHHHIDHTISTFEFGSRYQHVAITDLERCRSFIVGASEIQKSVENSDNDKSSASKVVVHCAPHATDMLLGYTEKIEIWNLETGSMEHSLVFDRNTKYYRILEYHNGYIIIIGEIGFWFEPFTDTTLLRVENHRLSEERIKYDGIINRIVSQSGSFVAFTNMSTDVFLHNLKDHETVRLIYDGEQEVIGCHEHLRFCAHGNRIIDVVRDLNLNHRILTAIIWNTRDGEQVTTISLLPFRQLHSVSLSPSGQSFYVCGEAAWGSTWESKKEQRLYYLQNTGVEYDSLPDLDGGSPTIDWYSLVDEEFPVVEPSTFSLVSSGSKHRDKDPKPLAITVEVPLNVNKNWGKIHVCNSDAQATSDLEFSIHTKAGVVSAIAGGLYYGTSIDVYMDGQWIYKAGRPFLWIPLSLRSKFSSSAYAAQCLVIFPNTGGCIMLRFGSDPTIAKCGAAVNDLYETNNSPSNIPIESVGLKKRRIEYLVQIEGNE